MQLVKEFAKAGGDGEKLQRLLENRAKNSVNWVSKTSVLCVKIKVSVIYQKEHELNVD